MFKRPVAATYLAALINAWAVFEAMMCDFLEYMISEPYLTAENRRLDDLGTALFAQFPTFQQRWGLLQAILSSRLTAQEQAHFKRPLKSVRASLDKVSKKRGDLVHSIWGTANDDDEGTTLLKSKPYSVIRDITVGNIEEVSYENLLADIHAIQAARKRFEGLASDIKRRREVSSSHSKP